MVSNEKPEDQRPKEDSPGNEAVTVMRLLQKFLALTLGQHEINTSMSVTCSSSPITVSIL